MSDRSNIEVSVVAHPRATTGEGPVWDRRTGRLHWLDIPARLYHCFDPRSGRNTTVNTGRRIGALATRSNGGLIAATEDGFAWLDPNSGELTLIRPVESNLTTNRMNDGKCDARGRFFAGTMDSNGVGNHGALYRLDPDLSVTKLLDGIGISNGIDWSPDGTTMYYADSTSGGVDAFAFDGKSGTLHDRRRFVSIPSGAGVPDGMTLDADGYLWVAIYGGAQVRRYSPDAELDFVVELPASQITSCAFGGDDLSDLYVTSAANGIDAAAEELAGALFKCSPGFIGQYAHEFAG